MTLAPARESLLWIGLGLGLLSFAASAYAGPPPRLYAIGGWPSPEAITAYTAAVCGAVVTMANTIMLIWHKLQAPPRKKRRKRKPDGNPDPPTAGPAPAGP